MNEGVVVIIYGDKIFVIYLVSVIDYWYVMGLLWVDVNVDLFDFVSWYKKVELVFISNVELGCFGFGYNSFVKVEDGIIDLMIYYSCDYKEFKGILFIDFNCYVWVCIIMWDKNGFLVFLLEFVD